MRILKLLVLIVLLVPVMSVMGNIASSAQTLGPVSVGPYRLQFDEIAHTGASISLATEELMRKQVAFIVKFLQQERIKSLDLDEVIYRIDTLAKRSV